MNMIETQKLVAEIAAWNDDDAEACMLSESGSCFELDLHCVDERSLVIDRLTLLVRENHILSPVEKLHDEELSEERDEFQDTQEKMLVQIASLKKIIRDYEKETLLNVEREGGLFTRIDELKHSVKIVNEENDMLKKKVGDMAT